MHNFNLNYKFFFDKQGCIKLDLGTVHTKKRESLAAAYRMMAKFGWEHSVFSHISVRASKGSKMFYLNPFGKPFSQVTASNLICVDYSGERFDSSSASVNPAALRLHSAILEARPDVNCVCHVQTKESLEMTQSERNFKPISQNALIILSKMSYHHYKGWGLCDTEKRRLIDSLGDNSFLMLRNQGIISCSSSIPKALDGLHLLEFSCSQHCKAIKNGEFESFNEAWRKHVEEIEGEDILSADLSRNWSTVLSQLDVVDSSYRF